MKDNEISKNGYAGVWVRERGRGIIEFNRLFGNGLGPIKAAVEDRCEVTLHRNQGTDSCVLFVTGNAQLHVGCLGKQNPLAALLFDAYTAGIMSVIGRSYEESHKDAEDVGR